MNSKVITHLATKLSIPSPKVISKAKEFLRLINIKIGSSSALGLTDTCKVVISLQMAATICGFPFDKEIVYKVAGMSKKIYLSQLKSLECLLDVQSNLTVKEIAVQFDCTRVIKPAQEILKRYISGVESSLLESQKDVIDFNQTTYPAAAVFVVCRHLKVRLDKNKLLNLVKMKKMFDKVCAQMDTYAQHVLEEKTVSMKRPKSMLDQVDLLIDEEKKIKIQDDEPNDDDDYEQWKQKILESTATNHSSTGTPIS